jgi:hypothetical protein
LLSGRSFQVLSRKRAGSLSEKFSMSRLPTRTARRTAASRTSPVRPSRTSRPWSVVTGSTRNGIVCSMHAATEIRCSRDSALASWSAATSAEANSLSPVVGVTTSPISRSNTASTSPVTGSAARGSTRQPPSTAASTLSSSDLIERGAP